MFKYIVDLIKKQKGEHIGENKVPLCFLLGLLPSDKFSEFVADGVGKISELVAGEKLVFFVAVEPILGWG
jgi:hypothetical protein